MMPPAVSFDTEPTDTYDGGRLVGGGRFGLGSKDSGESGDCGRFGLGKRDIGDAGSGDSMSLSDKSDEVDEGDGRNEVWRNTGAWPVPDVRCGTAEVEVDIEVSSTLTISGGVLSFWKPLGSGRGLGGIYTGFVISAMNAESKLRSPLCLVKL